MLLLKHCALRKCHVIKGQNVLSFAWSDYEWKKVQMRVIKLHSINVLVQSKGMLAKNIPCMRNSNLEIRIAGSSGHLQQAFCEGRRKFWQYYVINL